MSDILMLPAPEQPKKKIWRTWKWVGLLLFAATLLLRGWLPDVVVAAGWLVGLIVAANLLFHGFRRLKERLLWRVRNRILGAFVIAGFLPLLLALGIAGLIGYMLAGQLAANYLQSSIAGLTRELSSVNVELERSLDAAAPAQGFGEAASKVFERHRAGFPQMAARLLEPKSDGTAGVVRVFDPNGILASGDESPVTSVGQRPPEEGIVRDGNRAFLAVLRSIAPPHAHLLEVTAPLNRHIEDRLEAENDIYASFLPGTSATVSKDGMNVRVEVGEDKRRDPESEERIARRFESSSRDPRRKISWLAVLKARTDAPGKDDEGVAPALIQVPLSTLYSVYLGGYEEIGQAVIWVIIVLGGFFLAAELISLLIGLTISRRVTRSVHDLYEGTLALQQGDLQHRIPVRGHDQLGVLAHSFNQMSAAIVRLLEEVSEKKRLEQELQIAREVQATLFPKQLPHPPGLSLFGGCEPARAVSGDYYDFIVEEENRLHIVVADISGKGISAALLMANLQAAMRAQLLTMRHGSTREVEASLAEVVSQLNRQIFLNSPAAKYATLFLSLYDAGSRRLTYCNAGHLPPILLDGSVIRRLDAGGTVVGLFDSASYESETVELPAGSTLAIFTDGISEAVNDEDEEFGEERLIKALRPVAAETPEIIYRRVIEQVGQWQGKLKQQDDITLIVAKVL